MRKPEVKAAILEFLQSGEKFVGCDIVDELKEKKRYNQRVIYRNLKQLVEAGVVCCGKNPEGDQRYNNYWLTEKYAAGVEEEKKIGPRGERFFPEIDVPMKSTPPEDYILKVLYKLYTSLPVYSKESSKSTLTGFGHFCESLSTKIKDLPPEELGVILGLPEDSSSKPTEVESSKAKPEASAASGAHKHRDEGFRYKDAKWAKERVPSTPWYKRKYRDHDRLKPEADRNCHIYYKGLTDKQRNQAFEEAYNELMRRSFKTDPNKLNAKMIPVKRRLHIQEARITADIKGMKYKDYLVGIFEGYLQGEIPKRSIPTFDRLSGPKAQDLSVDYERKVLLPSFRFDRSEIAKWLGKRFLPENFTGDSDQCEFYRNHIYPEAVRVAKIGAPGDGKEHIKLRIREQVTRLVGSLHLILPKAWVEGYGKHHDIEELEGLKVETPEWMKSGTAHEVTPKPEASSE